MVSTINSATIVWLTTYAIGFIVRPVGALLFGYLGDIYGRKSIFMATLWIMGIATALCGCLPTKSQIGDAAGIILIVLRICQGEYGAAVAYIAEHALSQVMATFGLSLSLASCLIFRTALSAADWSNFGWRFPFLFSLLLIGVSLYARSKLLESPIFTQAKEAGEIAPSRFSKAALKPANFLTILIAIVGTCMGQGVLAQVSQAYPLTFLINLGVPLVTAYTILLIPCLFRPFENNLATSPYRDAYSPFGMGFCIWVLVMCAAISYGPLAAFLAELFPTNIRFTGTAACYHIGVGAIGGITGVVALSISTATGNMYGGLFYPIAVAGVSGLVGIFFLPETNGRDLTAVGDEGSEKGAFETSN
ncbi:UNVERIFIED_CONTAM: hypothetical protein HDU68_003700 [Siphonaria sp. JEL0065]|nr:hypothetical protein HDU68_003700 [Siphonaria sp. JEL0065]